MAIKTLSDLQFEFSKNVVKLITWCERRFIKVTFGEVFRPEQMQKWYFDHGYTRTMNSQHMKRLAVDLNFFFKQRLCYDFDKIKPIGEYWKSLHEKNRWGGDWQFQDCDHFEMLDY